MDTGPSEVKPILKKKQKESFFFMSLFTGKLKLKKPDDFEWIIKKKICHVKIKRKYKKK